MANVEIKPRRIRVVIRDESEDEAPASMVPLVPKKKVLLASEDEKMSSTSGKGKKLVTKAVTLSSDEDSSNEEVESLPKEFLAKKGSKIKVSEEEENFPSPEEEVPKKGGRKIKVLEEKDSTPEEEVPKKGGRKIKVSEEKEEVPKKGGRKIKVSEEKENTPPKGKKETKITLIEVGADVELPEIPDDLSVHEVATQYAPPGWEAHFKAQESKIERVSALLNKCTDPYSPCNSRIFRAFQLTRPEDIRVVILGQDPYPGMDVATGLAFSTHPENVIPQSLGNIFKEIGNCIPGYKKPLSGCLDHWALQGVFLINACLTCPIGDARGHGKFSIWKPFITATINYIGQVNRECFYLLWGKDAQEFRSEIKTSKPARILVSSHPSSRSASLGFFGCGHFAQVNKELVPPIRW